MSVEKHIEIAWFGISVDYQHTRTDDDRSVAGTLYATVESDALGHADSAPDTPFTLQCHIDNERGRGFWESRGYRIIPDPKLQVEDDVYYRMVR